MQLGFAFITCERVPGDPRGDVELYADALALAEQADEGGLDSVWVSEHHFVDDSFVSSPLALCAAIAARTRRIRIGTGVALAPLYHPLRLAEEAATVDLVAGGRLVLGLGQGWREEEFEVFGIERQGLGATMRDTVGALRQAWSDDLVTTGVPEPGVSVRPKPARPGGPPIWLGGSSEHAVRRAARIADGFLATRVGPEEFAVVVCRLRDELARAGRAEEDFTFAVQAPVFPWPDPDEGWRLVAEHWHYVTWKLDDIAAARARKGSPAAAPPLTPPRERQLREQAIVGTPGDVAREIVSYAAAAGVDVHFVGRLYWPGLRADVQTDALRLYADEVRPLVVGAPVVR